MVRIMAEWEHARAPKLTMPHTGQACLSQEAWKLGIIRS